MGEAIITDVKRAPGLAVVGETIKVLARGEETGSYEVFHQAGAEGSGPPPHCHPWDEAFVVTRGQIEFGVGEKTASAHAGSFVHVPAGTFHWFRFGPGGGEMISVTSATGAAAMFTQFDAEIAPDRPDLLKLAKIAAAHACQVPPPAG